jgi:hypothetical protein
MWKCKKCNEELEDTFDSCWKCTKEPDIIKKSNKESNLTTSTGLDTGITQKESDQEYAKKENDFRKLKKLFEDKFPENVNVKMSYTGGLTIKDTFMVHVKVRSLNPLQVFLQPTFFNPLNIVDEEYLMDKYLKFIYKEWFKIKDDDRIDILIHLLEDKGISHIS